MIPDWKIIQYANYLRDATSIGYNDKIDDIDSVVKSAGYQYFEDNFGNDFSAISKRITPGNYVIGFNKQHFWSEKFRRFTISHELGHLSIPEHRAILDKTELHRSKPEYKSKEPIEIEADKFAINFLVPKPAFVTQSKYKRFNSETIEELSGYFNVSTYAISLHFIDNTDLACTLIVSDISGNILYERRSKKFKDGFNHQFLYKQPIPFGSQTFDYLKDKNAGTNSEIELSTWYPDLNSTIEAGESLIELGYNNIVLTFIEPYKSSDEEEY